MCLAEVVEMTNGKGERRYRFVAEIRPGWFLEERSFPEIVVPAVVDGRKRAFISGEANGGYNFGRGSFADVNSASAGAFAATWDDESGTYFGVEDSHALCRRCGFGEDGRGLFFTEIVNGWKTGRDETDYDIVVRDVRRTGEKLVWTDFLDIYRAWDDRQSWSRLKLADRTDLPGWLKSGAAMTLASSRNARPPSPRRQASARVNAFVNASFAGNAGSVAIRTKRLARICFTSLIIPIFSAIRPPSERVGDAAGRK